MSQEKPEGAGRSQEEPKGPRKTLEDSGEPRRSQEEPRTIRTNTHGTSPIALFRNEHLRWKKT